MLRSTIFDFTASELATAPQQAYTASEATVRERPHTEREDATSLHAERPQYDPFSEGVLDWMKFEVAGPEHRSETTTFSAPETPLTTSASDVIEDDSDDDFEVELTAKFIDLANIAEQKEDLDRVVGYIRLAQPRFYQRLPTPVRDDDMQRMEARSLVRLGRLPEARSLCERLIRCKITDDAVRASVLEASFLLAQIHFQEGTLEDAHNLCLQVIKGRARLKPKGHAYLSAIALMVLISKAQGQSLQADALEEFIPTTFIRPSFEIPVQGAPSPETISSGSSEEHKAKKKLAEMRHVADDHVAAIEVLSQFSVLAIFACNY